MKRFHPLFAFTALTISLYPAANATAPSVSFNVNTFQLGDSTTFAPYASDPEADMDYATIEVSGPGTNGWVTISPSGGLPVPSPGQPAQQSGVSVQQTWTPTQPGLWTVRATVHSLNDSTTVLRTFDVLDGTRAINSLTVPNGANQIYTFRGEIVTVESASPDTVNVQNGGNLILWSGGKITLKPGFHAASGSSFWAAIDHDMNGYSDVEEATDTDGDGMFDAWEVDHGLNPIVNDANGDLDGDGVSNIAEFRAGRNPNDASDGKGLPTNAQLVIRTGSSTFLGVDTTTWQLSNAPAP